MSSENVLHEVKAKKILAAHPVLDLHCDTLLRWKVFQQNIRHSHKHGPYGQSKKNWKAHTDLPRLMESGFGGAFMGIHSLASPAESFLSWKTLLKQVRKLKRIAKKDKRFKFVAGLGQLTAFNDPLHFAFCPGIEGAHMMESDQENWEELVGLGAGYVTVCHLRNNWAATCSYTPKLSKYGIIKYPKRPGTSKLTPKGIQLVKFLADMGIAVDVSHVNSAGLRHVCEIMQQREQVTPVICTHTGFRGTGCAPRPKNKGVNRDDFVAGDYEEVFESGHKDRYDPAFRNISVKDAEAIKDTGGVIGVLLAPMYLLGKNGSGESGTVDEKDYGNDSRRVAEHILSLMDVVGESHIAIGTDYDGRIDLPGDQRGCIDFIKIVGYLLDMGVTESQIAGFLRGNALRVLTKIWEKRNIDNQKVVAAKFE